ncbi:MAG: matrixin family metalloprotease, partial [Pyrinomonadaceae bacterium]|nr:matrixin family metalloprotease [Pyrinomonadaceae bacterium]
MTALFLMVSLLSWIVPAPAYTLQYANPSAVPQIKWANTTITIAFSTSLNTPPPNIKPGSDVVGAARRALAHWSQNSNIRFIETTSTAQSISPGGSGDGINLISVANTPENAAVFPACGSLLVKTGQTRVIYDPGTGAILESDIVINPCLQFSTDGTVGTYDLESTLTHELGHLLGLEHSGVIGATMQPQQGQNGLYGLPAWTPRTLSEDDRAGIHVLYGPSSGLGSIAGTLRADTPIFGAHVWAENTGTGQVIAGNITFPNGTFRIDSLPPGTYRVIAEPLDEPIKAREIASTIGPYGQLENTQPLFRTIELASQLTVSANMTTPLNILIANNAAPTINPRLFGIARGGLAELSTIPVPLTPGNTYTFYAGGEGLTQSQILSGGITITSPYFTVNQSSVTYTVINTSAGPLPAVSFDVTVAPSAPAGDYSVRFLATSNEIAYLSGALTIDYPEASAPANPIDDAQFFVRQHYIDFLNREPDTGGLQYWTEQITGNGTNTPPPCPAGDRACESNRRVRVSAAFFIENEFQQTGYFVYRMYEASFNRQPTFNEFVADRAKVSGGNNTEAKKQAFADEWVQRPDFLNNYPTTLSPEAFVDRLFSLA